MTSKPVVECSTEQTVNPFIVELIELGNEYNKAYPDSNYTICKVGVTTKEELRQNIKNAFTDMKAKHQYMETKMSISNILDNLNLLKKEYNQIASNYNPVSYDGCDVNFGSIMWYDAYAEDRLYSNPNERTEEQIDKDHERVQEIIREANNILAEHNLTQFLLEETAAYWLGIYNEPYTSVY